MKPINSICAFVTALSLLPTLVWSQVPNFVALSKQLKPAVVNISSSKKGHNPSGLDNDTDKNNFFDQFFNTFLGDKRTESLGSGFLISSDGYILTNDHVVDNASEIKVQLAGGETYPATLKGIDRNLDLALVKIESNKTLPTVKLGNSSKLETGEWVIAIGNPFGLEQTVTVGIVSAKGRVIDAAPYDNLIQTDASINPGNSGGPLFNSHGEVVGINTAIVAGGQGIGFAIPIDTAKSILPQLKQTGHVQRGWLGITIQKVSEDLATSFKIANAAGALITSVVHDSPADHAQLLRGDIIVTFNNIKINSISDLPKILNSVAIGDQVEISIFRNGEKIERIIKVEPNHGDAKNITPTTIANPLGATTMEITFELQERLGLLANSGIVITSVQEHGAANQAKLQPGDVIIEFNDQPVASKSDLEKYLSKHRKVDRLLIQRGEGLFFATMRLP